MLGLEVGSLLEEYEKLAQPARRGVLSRGPISTNLCFYVRGRTWLVSWGEGDLHYLLLEIARILGPQDKPQLPA